MYREIINYLRAPVSPICFFSLTGVATLGKEPYERRLEAVRNHPDYHQPSFKAQLILGYATESAGFSAIHLLCEWIKSDGFVFETPGLESEFGAGCSEVLRGGHWQRVLWRGKRL